MPKNKDAASRYRIIDNCINNKQRPFPTKAYLAAKCSTLLDRDISESTIEKDIRVMKKPAPIGFDAPIVYSKLKKGYTYSEIGFSIAELNLEDKEWESLNFAAQLLYQYKEVPIFANFKAAIERINARFDLGFLTEEPIVNELVQFEKAVDTKGMECINGIYEAIKESYSLSFNYHNIYKKEHKSYTLVPYLLKEHRNRWYLIGWREDKKQYATFGLDRISDLEVQQVKQKKRLDFNPSIFFQYATGIMEGNYKPSQIELTIQKPISELVLLEPLHETQALLGQTENGIKISLTVLVNEEFYLKLLGMGPFCVVNKPASVKKKMKSFVEQMLESYQ